MWLSDGCVAVFLSALGCVGPWWGRGGLVLVWRSFVVSGFPILCKRFCVSYHVYLVRDHFGFYLMSFYLWFSQCSVTF